MPATLIAKRILSVGFLFSEVVPDPSDKINDGTQNQNRDDDVLND